MTDKARGSHLPVLDGDGDAAEMPVVCRKLRTKLAFGSFEGTTDWRFGDSTTAAYWCLRTMEQFGPDGSFSHPHQCHTGRSCFAAPLGSELVASAPAGSRSRG